MNASSQRTERGYSVGYAFRLNQEFSLAAFLSLLFLSSVLALNADHNLVLDYSLMFFTFYAAIHIISRPRIVIPKGSRSHLAFLSLALLFSLLSASIHSSVPIAVFFLGVWAFVFSLLVVFGTIRDPVALASKVTKYVSLISIAIFIFTAYEYPFSLNRYPGFTHNQNSFSFFPAAVLMLTLGVWFSSVNDRLQNSWLMFMTSLTATMFLISTTSRGALVSVLGPLVLYALLVPKKSNLSKLSMLRGFFVLGGVIALCVLFALVFNPFEALIQKSVITHSEGEFARGRVSGWIASLEAWNFFGYGTDWRLTVIAEDENYGHNIFMTLLSRVGALPTFFVGLFFLATWLDLAKGVKNGDQYFAAPGFLLLSSYLIHGLVSSTFVAPGLWLGIFFYSLFVRFGCRKSRCGCQASP